MINDIEKVASPNGILGEYPGQTKEYSELGYKNHGIKIWHICQGCGKQRWVTLEKGRACKMLCLPCVKTGQKYRERKYIRIFKKRCSKCGKEYPATLKYFCKNKQLRSGISSDCRKCDNAWQRDYTLRTGRVKSRKVSLTPTQRKVRDAVSGKIALAFKGRKNGRHWESIVGYTLKDLMKHLEGLFQPGMNWDNYGRSNPNNNPPAWHMDHIIPVSAFNFNSSNDIACKQCWALSNLRPLWGDENSKKGTRINKPSQASLFL